MRAAEGCRGRQRAADIAAVDCGTLPRAAEGFRSPRTAAPVRTYVLTYFHTYQRTYVRTCLPMHVLTHVRPYALTHTPIRPARPWANRWLVLGVTLPVLLHLGVLYTPSLAAIFQLAPLTKQDWHSAAPPRRVRRPPTYLLKQAVPGGRPPRGAP